MSELIEAAKNNNAERVRVLLEGGANPNIQDRYSKTALDYAKDADNAEIIRLLGGE